MNQSIKSQGRQGASEMAGREEPKGAASFYLVAFMTVILTVIVASFINAVIADMKKSTDSELSQSAYDSALAGVEDAKLALKKYQTTCFGDAASSSYCQKAAKMIEDGDCRTVKYILYEDESDAERLLSETTSGDSSMTNQAYTCVTLASEVGDYRATLGSETSSKLVHLDAGDLTETVERLTISWFSASDATSDEFSFAGLDSNGNVQFGSAASGVNTPPTISVQILQTDLSFTADSFAYSKDGRTNRGTVFLTPTTGSDSPTTLEISAEEFVASNDKTANAPYQVTCAKSKSAIQGEFACSASIYLSMPINEGSNSRSAETFMAVVSLPYEQPSTSFSITMERRNSAGEWTTIAYDDVQAEVDSTGRASDLYRRVITRIENSDGYFPFPEYAVYLSGDGTSLTKDVSSDVDTAGKAGAF